MTQKISNMGDMKFEGTPEEWDALVKKNKELHYQKQVMNPYSSDSQSYTAYEKGFIEGFEKAKSTLYTEEQLRQAISIAKDSMGVDNDGESCYSHLSTEQIIQSLNQPK